MIHRHTRQDIDEYRERDAFNQSSAKAILQGGIQSFKIAKDELIGALDSVNDMYYEEKTHFIIGSAVDTWITIGKDVFDDMYFSSKMKRKPSAAEMSIVKRVFDQAFLSEDKEDEVKDGIWDIDNYKQALHNSMNEHEYKIREMKVDWMEDGRMNTFLRKPLVRDYWNELVSADGKQILSDSEVLKISDIYISMTTHKHTSWLFDDGTPNVDVVYQFPMYWEYYGVDCKGLPDMLYILHDKKRIMPINIKTTSEFALNFNRVVERRRYDIGESFYRYGLLQNLDTLSDLIHKDVKDYHVSNGAFVVESTTRSGTPMIYPLSDAAMNIGAVGDGEYKKGWTQAINKYKMWKEVDFSLEEMFKDTNGIVWIDGEFEYMKLF